MVTIKNIYPDTPWQRCKTGKTTILENKIESLSVVFRRYQIEHIECKTTIATKKRGVPRDTPQILLAIVSYIIQL